MSDSYFEELKDDKFLTGYTGITPSISIALTRTSWTPVDPYLYSTRSASRILSFSRTCFYPLSVFNTLYFFHPSMDVQNYISDYYMG